MDHSPVEPVQVFQQPDAGTAVNVGDEELCFADAAVGEIEQFMPDLLVVQVSEAVSKPGVFDLDAGMVFY
jgi:hypothetical protein